MKSIRIAGLCLAAVFVMNMVAAGTASAAPHWLVCLPSHTGTTTTKWTESQCKVASSSGTWEWSELKGTEKTETQGTLTLESKSILGNIEVKCSGTDVGSVGPGALSRTTEVKVAKCEAGENCEKYIAGSAEALHTPWNSELKETEGVIHATIRGTGKGEPGWTATCRAFGKEEANECTSEAGLLVLSNDFTPGTVGPLLVLADFIHPNNPKANCKVTGVGTGDVLGSISILLASGRGLRVSK